MAGADHQRGLLSALDPHVRAAGQRLVDVVPWLEGPLATLRGYYSHASVRLRQWRYNRAHSAPIRPYRIAWVDPDRITRLTEPPGLPRFRCLGLVADGDWDRRERRFEGTDVYRAFQRRYEDDLAWSETDFYERVLEEVRRGDAPWGCDSRSELDARCEALDDLYETIAEEGFRTQREILDDGVDDPIGSRRRSRYARIINDEIAVDVGRDGDLLFADGRNRLSIAKVLDVETVPVLILRRHARWVAFRDRMAEHAAETGALPDAVADHPDLRPLISE